jgi:hypothetical protein
MSEREIAQIRTHPYQAIPKAKLTHGALRDTVVKVPPHSTLGGALPLDVVQQSAGDPIAGQWHVRRSSASVSGRRGGHWPRSAVPGSVVEPLDMELVAADEPCLNLVRVGSVVGVDEVPEI